MISESTLSVTKSKRSPFACTLLPITSRHLFFPQDSVTCCVRGVYLSRCSLLTWLKGLQGCSDLASKTSIERWTPYRRHLPFHFPKRITLSKVHPRVIKLKVDALISTLSWLYQPHVDRTYVVDMPECLKLGHRDGEMVARVESGAVAV
jgi:hypothetical protein